MTKHLIVEPEVCAAMGMTQDQIAELTLGQFYMIALAKGHHVRARDFDVPSSDGNGGLTIMMANSSGVRKSENG